MLYTSAKMCMCLWLLPGGALGEDVSPEAVKVSISAEGGSHVLAPIVSHSTVEGGIHIQHHYHGAGDSAAAKPTQEAAKPHTSAALARQEEHISHTGRANAQGWNWAVISFFSPVLHSASMQSARGSCGLLVSVSDL
ncbi:hypothetical protein AALO_G00309350 [Alosa alosa]|uniref:Uncharacterized protein n=1 Tax=Alosa alosa TaxID=278164 RepID=A0AAV6FHF0_9TELE|nr:hypothetical protein AALO_G00309350 [Alosa alosa]